MSRAHHRRGKSRTLATEITLTPSAFAVVSQQARFSRGPLGDPELDGLPVADRLQSEELHPGISAKSQYVTENRREISPHERLATHLATRDSTGGHAGRGQATSTDAADPQAYYQAPRSYSSSCSASDSTGGRGSDLAGTSSGYAGSSSGVRTSCGGSFTTGDELSRSRGICFQDAMGVSGGSGESATTASSATATSTVTGGVEEGGSGTREGVLRRQAVLRPAALTTVNTILEADAALLNSEDLLPSPSGPSGVEVAVASVTSTPAQQSWSIIDQTNVNELQRLRDAQSIVLASSMLRARRIGRPSGNDRTLERVSEDSQSESPTSSSDGRSPPASLSLFEPQSDAALAPLTERKPKSRKLDRRRLGGDVGDSESGSTDRSGFGGALSIVSPVGSDRNLISGTVLSVASNARYGDGTDPDLIPDMGAKSAAFQASVSYEGYQTQGAVQSFQPRKDGLIPHLRWQLTETPADAIIEQAAIAAQVAALNGQNIPVDDTETESTDLQGTAGYGHAILPVVSENRQTQAELDYERLFHEEAGAMSTRHPQPSIYDDELDEPTDRTTGGEYSLFDSVPLAEECLASLRELDISAQQNDPVAKAVAEIMAEKERGHVADNEEAKLENDESTEASPTHDMEEMARRSRSTIDNAPETNSPSTSILATDDAMPSEPQPSPPGSDGSGHMVTGLSQSEPARSVLVVDANAMIAQASKRMQRLRKSLEEAKNNPGRPFLASSITLDTSTPPTTSGNIMMSSPFFGRRLYQVPFKQADLYFGTETGFLVEFPGYNSPITQDIDLCAKFVPHEGLRFSSVEFAKQSTTQCGHSLSEVLHYAELECPDCVRFKNQLYTGADPTLLPQGTPDPLFIPVLPLFAQKRPTSTTTPASPFCTMSGAVASSSVDGEVPLMERAPISTMYVLEVVPESIESKGVLPLNAEDRTPSYFTPISERRLSHPYSYKSPSPALSSAMGYVRKDSIDLGASATQTSNSVRDYEYATNEDFEQNANYHEIMDGPMQRGQYERAPDGAIQDTPLTTKSIVFYLHGYFFLLSGCAQIEPAPNTDTGSSQEILDLLQRAADATQPIVEDTVRYHQHQLWFNESWNAHISYANALMVSSRLTLGRYVFPSLSYMLRTMGMVTTPTLVPTTTDSYIPQLAQPFVAELSITLGERPLISALLSGLKHLLPLILPRMTTISEVSNFLTDPNTKPGPQAYAEEGVSALMRLQFLALPFHFAQQLDVYSRTFIALMFTKPLWESAPKPTHFPSQEISSRLQSLWLVNTGKLESNLPLPPPLVNILPRLASILANLHWQIGVQCGTYARLSMEAHFVVEPQVNESPYHIKTGSESNADEADVYPDVLPINGEDEHGGHSNRRASPPPVAPPLGGTEPLGDIFKVVCPEAVLKAYPFASHILVAPHKYVPFTPILDLPSANLVLNGNNEGDVPSGDEDAERELPDFRLFDALRFSFLEDVANDLEVAVARYEAYRTGAVNDDADSGAENDKSKSLEELERQCAVTAFNMALRQLLVLGFDTAVEKATNYFAPQDTLQEPIRALINLCLISASRKRSTPNSS